MKNLNLNATFRNILSSKERAFTVVTRIIKILCIIFNHSLQILMILDIRRHHILQTLGLAAKEGRYFTRLGLTFSSGCGCGDAVGGLEVTVQNANAFEQNTAL
jgi:hypothetical protein